MPLSKKQPPTETFPLTLAQRTLAILELHWGTTPDDLESTLRVLETALREAQADHILSACTLIETDKGPYFSGTDELGNAHTLQGALPSPGTLITYNNAKFFIRSVA